MKAQLPNKIVNGVARFFLNDRMFSARVRHHINDWERFLNQPIIASVDGQSRSFTLVTKPRAGTPPNSIKLQVKGKKIPDSYDWAIAYLAMLILGKK